MKIIEGKARIIYKNDLLENRIPYGIRDDNGFLFHFPKPFMYTDQEDRYYEELGRLNELANFLLKQLNNQR
jgi:hypothetical protein